MEIVFRDRAEAGRLLAERLASYAGRSDVLVLALPRGGVPVATEVACALNVPLDVFLVRKLGVPGHEELAMGAIASGGVRVLNAEVLRGLNFERAVIDRVAEQEQEELERRERVYRAGRPALDVRGRIVILVDDGVATGATMRAAATALRQQQPARIVVGVPTAAVASRDQIRGEVDDVICLTIPEPFYSVGASYVDFSAIPDEEVRELLRRTRQEPGNAECDQLRAGQKLPRSMTE